ncbi:MAG: IS30 family transposase [Clostridium sp.]|jgi:IS30 family transposase|nr:IS30 family transposase [Clostridium sp.]
MTLQRSSDLSEKTVCLADAGQRKHNEKAADKGRGLKIGHDHKLANHIGDKIKNAKRSPDAGHWETGLVAGKQGTEPAVLTLAERKTRQSLYVAVKNRTQKEAAAAVRRARRRVGGNFDDVCRSVTADNGSEFLDGEAVRKAARCAGAYYAHPYSSWERGSNENGSRIPRRFLPKGTDIGKRTQNGLQRIEG